MINPGYKALAYANRLGKKAINYIGASEPYTKVQKVYGEIKSNPVAKAAADGASSVSTVVEDAANGLYSAATGTEIVQKVTGKAGKIAKDVADAANKNTAYRYVQSKRRSIGNRIDDAIDMHIGGTERINTIAKQKRYKNALRWAEEDKYTEEQFNQAAAAAFSYGSAGKPIGMTASQRMHYRYHDVAGNLNKSKIAGDAAKIIGAAGTVGAAGYGAVSYFGDDD